MKTDFYVYLLLAGLYTVAPGQLVTSHHDPNEPKDHVHYAGEAIACLKLVPNNADFAFHFFNKVTLEEPNKNIFFSPVSISTAFAMLALGARSTTQTQILEGLAFNLTEIQEKEIHEGFHNLIHMLSHPESGVQLNMGSAIFLTEKLKPLKKFLDDAKALYQLETLTTNFNNPTEAEKQINDYIEKKTHGKITNLVKEMDPQTVMLLATFVFFRGKSCSIQVHVILLIKWSLQLTCHLWKMFQQKFEMLFAGTEAPHSMLQPGRAAGPCSAPEVTGEPAGSALPIAARKLCSKTQPPCSFSSLSWF